MQAQQEKKMTAVAQLLRKTGYPMTVQRRMILQALLERQDHPTADQIYAQVKERIPGVSKTTVYRVLETFVKLNAIRKVNHSGSSVRFDARVDHHHHLICVICQKMADLEEAGHMQVRLPKARRHGFKISDYSIHFSGICLECQKKNS